MLSMVNTSKTGDTFPPAAQISLWLPPSWNGLRLHLERLRDSKGIPITIHTSYDDELHTGVLYNSICGDGSIIAMSTNFTYRTHLSRVVDAKDRAADNHDESTSVQSRLSAMASPSMLRYMSDSSDEEMELRETANKFAIMFIVFTRSDVTNNSVEDLRKRIIKAIQQLRIFYEGVNIMVVMHGIRLYALHGYASQADSEHSHGGSQSQFIHSSALDDIICSLMVEYHIDTVEVEDDVDLAKFLINASSAVEQCYHRKSIMHFKIKPHHNAFQEESAVRRAWLTQLLQIPEVGKDAANAIASEFQTPAEIIDAVAKSSEQFITKLRQIPVGAKATRKLSLSIAKRVAALYSRNTLPSDLVLDNEKS